MRLFSILCLLEKWDALRTSQDSHLQVTGEMVAAAGQPVVHFALGRSGKFSRSI
jgi:hypothetical protein